MNCAAIVDLIAGLRGEMCACANPTGGTSLLGVAHDGEVVGMAETAERFRFG